MCCLWLCTRRLEALADGPFLSSANKAVENAGTVIGLKLKDGILLAVEKLVQSKLLVPGANRRIATVDTHAGLVCLLCPFHSVWNTSQ